MQRLGPEIYIFDLLSSADWVGAASLLRCYRITVMYTTSTDQIPDAVNLTPSTNDDGTPRAWDTLNTLAGRWYCR